MRAAPASCGGGRALCCWKRRPGAGFVGVVVCVHSSSRRVLAACHGPGPGAHGCFPGRCATSSFCSSFGAASFAAPAKASAIWRALLVSGGCRRLWFLVLAAAARIHGGSCWWQAQSSSQSCLYFSYVIGAFVQSWWTPVLLYPSRARLCVHVYLCCLFSY